MCTGIRLTAGDGSVVCARTLEFAIDLESEVVMVPRRFSRKGRTPDSDVGLSWKTQYASVGANGVGLPFIFDGLNETGLSVGTFYFPGTAGYMAYDASQAANTIAPWQVGSWILETCASVAETRTRIASVIVPAVVLETWGFSPPVHYVVHDASGDSVVIEYVDGDLCLHDNPFGVMTNSPTFDWHMTNLRNYVNLSYENVAAPHIGPVDLTPLGQGSGMLGLPGDFTPPSRFIRAAVFSRTALPSATGEEALLQAFHILNNFDIPLGVAREAKRDEYGNIIADYTMWTSANDLAAKRFCFRTYANSRIRSVELTKMNLDSSDIVRLTMSGPETFEMLSK